MKFVMDERLKHRLVGLAVVISLAVIFVPAVVKKSTQRFDGKNITTVKLPLKPAMPKIALPEEQAMFKRVKVAHVEIPAFEQKTPATIAKAQSLSDMNEVKPSIIVAANAPVIPAVITNKATPPVVPKDTVNVNKETGLVTAKLTKALAKTSVASVVNTKQKVARAVTKSKVLTLPKNNYSVQLAYFSKESNAVSLINKLKGNGYKAYYIKVNSKKGQVYKVLVGNTNEKQQAMNLQKQLASSMQLKGFVVPATGIS
jgi:DedD protein